MVHTSVQSIGRCRSELSPPLWPATALKVVLPSGTGWAWLGRAYVVGAKPVEALRQHAKACPRCVAGRAHPDRLYHESGTPLGSRSAHRIGNPSTVSVDDTGGTHATGAAGPVCVRRRWVNGCGTVNCLDESNRRYRAAFAGAELAFVRRISHFGRRHAQSPVRHDRTEQRLLCSPGASTSPIAWLSRSRNGRGATSFTLVAPFPLPPRVIRRGTAPPPAPVSAPQR